VFLPISFSRDSVTATAPKKWASFASASRFTLQNTNLPRLSASTKPQFRNSFRWKLKEDRIRSVPSTWLHTSPTVAPVTGQTSHESAHSVRCDGSRRFLTGPGLPKPLAWQRCRHSSYSYYNSIFAEMLHSLNKDTLDSC
jgi:hypothetical protein